MKPYKPIATVMALMLAVVTLSAQTNPPVPTGMKGTMHIDFNSRVSDPAPANVPDIYKLSLTVSDSVVFEGAITNMPFIDGGILSGAQNAWILYGIDCSVINPANRANVVNIGRFSGRVPITPEGIYDYDAGSLKILVNAMGRAPGFESQFVGKALGKPLAKKQSLMQKAQNAALSITKQVAGKTMAITVTNYDRMSFDNRFSLAAGPVQIYPKVRITGTMIYDYERGAWYFRDTIMTPEAGGVAPNDRLTGSIRWSEKPRVGNTRQGEYTFDVRVNEPPPSESAAFASAADESAFFQVDTSLASLTGTMKYTDGFVGNKVRTSDIQVNLVGNGLTKQQTMALAKQIIFACIVPMNNE